MINRVIVSGVLVDEPLEYVVNKEKEYLSYCDAKIVTQDYKKDKLKRIKVRLYYKMAQDFIANQLVYKENLCMYYGEVFYVEKDDITFVKITETPQVLARLDD